MEEKEEETNWLKCYLEGEQPLYDAILMYMLEERIVPLYLAQRFNEAVANYQSGKTEDLEIGLEKHYPKSQAKRRSNSKNIVRPILLYRKLIEFKGLGLKLVKPESAQRNDTETINLLKLKLLAHNSRFTFQSNELEFMTAYQAVGKIFNISESSVRKELEKLSPKKSN